MRIFPAIWHVGRKPFRAHKRYMLTCPECGERCAFRKTAFGWFCATRGCPETCNKTDQEITAAFGMTAEFAKIA